MTFSPKQRITLDGKTYLLPSDVLQQIKAIASGYEALTMDAKNSECPDDLDEAAIARNDQINRIVSNNR